MRRGVMMDVAEAIEDADAPPRLMTTRKNEASASRRKCAPRQADRQVGGGIGGAAEQAAQRAG